MKSPWKFLVGLTRRHDKKDPVEPPAHLTDDVHSNSDRRETPSVLPTAPEPAAEVDRNAPVEPDGDGFEPVDDVAALAVIASTAAGLKPQKQTQALRKKPAPRARKQAQLVHRNDIQTPPVLPHSILNNDQELDDDIRQLRLQLTEKLRLQNAQLRRMLARFDR